MKAIFRVKSITQSWAPPFKKEVKQKNFSVKTGNSFEEFNGLPVFKFLEARNKAALIEFRKDFTLKGHEHPQNNRVWLQKGKEVSFSYLWGQNGTTKIVCLKSIK